ncbi:MAG: hypothetical protein IKD04_08510, partial [Clostridia bacterium]|nr:hypothetical protein [Clostridia bacterium]
VPEVAGEHVLITFSPATGTIDAADWDENPVDFIAADGIWTVEDEVPEVGTLTVLDTTTTTGFASKVEFGYNIYMEYSGDTSAIIERGYIALDSTKYDGESAITHETPGIIKAALSGYGTFVGATIYDIPVKNFNVDYYFIPYVYDGTNYIYGDQLAMSYADYLVTRTTGTAAVNIRARAYLDMLYAITGESLYDGAGLAELPDASVVYTKTTDGTNYSNPGDVQLTATTATTGFASKVEFGINFTNLAYTGDTSTVTERGYIAIDSSKYDGTSAITHETAGVIKAALNGWGTSIAATIYDIPFKNFDTDYIFVPYILDNGEYVYGEYVEMNYADYFIGRINGSRSNASQQQTVQKCVTYLNAYEALTGTSIHTVG